MIKSIVLDDFYSDIFLKIAFDEKLLEIKDNSVKERIFYTNVPHNIRQELLEQIVLTPEIFNTTWYYNAASFNGYLIENQNFKIVKPIAYSNINNFTITPEFIIQMLLVRGHNYDVEKVEKILKKYLKIIRIEDNILTEIKSEAIDPKKDFLTFLEHIELNKEKIKDIAKREKISNIYGNRMFQEIAYCMDEYYDVFQIANNYNSLIKIPIPGNVKKIDTSQYNNEDIILLRIVANELGVHSYKPTVKQSLALAEESATKALRTQLELWKDNLKHNNISELEYIRKEILFATKKLNKRKSLSKISNLVTYFGVPLALLGEFVGISSIPGISISVIGAITTFGTELIEKKNNWAMFGNK